MGKEKSDTNKDTLYEIETEEQDNLYTLPDDYDSTECVDDIHNLQVDNENINEESGYEGYEDGDDDTEDDEEYDEDDDNRLNRGNIFSLLFKILSTPVEGWKELKRRRYLPEEIASGMFYPSIAVASLSEFASMIFTTVGLSECLMEALITFIAFFFGYFTVMLIGGVILPKLSREIIKTAIGKEFVMVNISTLALFYAAMRLLPMIDAVLVFLPIWTIYLIYKGVRILRIPEEVETRTKILLTFLIIGSPLFWSWIMDIFF